MAAGLAIAFLALGQSVTAVISQTIGTLHFSVGAGEAASTGARPFGGRLRRRRHHTRHRRSRARRDQFRAVQRADVCGLGPGRPYPLLAAGLSAGHWFTIADTAADARPDIPPVVLGPALARSARHAGSGRSSPSASPRDPPASAWWGSTPYPPATATPPTSRYREFLERLDGGPGTANSIWLTTASTAHAAIDRATTAAANRLAAAGYPVSTTEIYITGADHRGSQRHPNIVDILGLVVVAIMLMGLVSTLSMGVIERTREVGILRCVGARARQIQQVFSAEAVVLAITLGIRSAARLADLAEDHNVLYFVELRIAVLVMR